VQDLDGLHRWKESTEHLADANPDNRMAALLKIDAQARLGEVAAATQGMSALLDKQPNFALIYDLAGAVAILRNDLASARAAFTKATILDPGLADAWISRGTLEAIARTPLDMPRLGNVRSADVLGYFDRALELDPSSASGQLGRGVILYGLGRFPDAAAAFADAERVAPWLALTSYNGLQSNLAVLRRYALQLASIQDKSGRGSTLQMQISQQSEVLTGRARESSTQASNNLATVGNSAARFDPKVLDTASPPELEALVKTYGLSRVQQANAARLDANSADLFQRNIQIQKGV